MLLNWCKSSTQSTENRRKQIIEVVQYIEERLKELDEEKEELKKYQQLDKQRRSLEYTIFEKELLDARQKLEEVEHALLPFTGFNCIFLVWW